MVDYRLNDNEWLETDGRGGFASGCVNGIRTRRYHALLLTATNSPTGRYVLVNGFDGWIQSENGTYPISSQRYAPDVVHPDAAARIVLFKSQPWPTWIFQLEDGLRIQHEIFIDKSSGYTILSWRLLARGKKADLFVRPFLSGRDYHSLHRENNGFRFDADTQGKRVKWNPYTDVPSVFAQSNGVYVHEPAWYRNFQYEQERNRGLDFIEDLASPGVFRWSLAQEALLVFSTLDKSTDISPEELVSKSRASEQNRRKEFPGDLELAADSYIVSRKKGKTIVAGYPWFTDWGRDTFIAMRGLCLTTGEMKTARDILIEWSGTVSDGMLPNRFPDQGADAEYNSVDASLWFVIAVHDYFQAMKRRRKKVVEDDSALLHEAIREILQGYAEGTRYGIRMDEDGLLKAGQPGTQLTWMDAKIGDWVITPRIGKPVEIQALWLNALWIATAISEEWKNIFDSGLESFRLKFWNENNGYLYDVIDVDHNVGQVDDSFRPNQIFAVGGLPLPLFDGDIAASIVEAVESKLLTPIGLRTLAPGSSGYAPYYQGGVRERDSAYHQGTVWPWLLGAFVEAWLRVRKNSVKAKREARSRFLKPLLTHLNEAGLGHISEIADADPPYTPRGCPFQAWSVGEAIRIADLLEVQVTQVKASGGQST